MPEPDEIELPAPDRRSLGPRAGGEHARESAPPPERTSKPGRVRPLSGSRTANAFAPGSIPRWDAVAHTA